jgi:uncharacterized protein YecE (DUF72 family)
MSGRELSRTCLAEYAKTFPTVGGDFSFYQFPSPDYWAKLFEGVPPGLTFGLKVPEHVTVLTWPGHARYGQRAGQANEHFLGAGLFERAFVKPLSPYRERVAVMMFEFGTFSKKEFPGGVNDFLESLGPFLEALPDGFRYGVEIRNKDYLVPDYFNLLTKNRVAHVFNAWTRMPTLAEQIELPGSFTTDLVAVRALLTKGRTYEQAVKTIEPYEEVKQPDPSTREALRKIVDNTLKSRARAVLFVNNRLEGCAPKTIEAVVSPAGSAVKRAK